MTAGRRILKSYIMILYRWKEVHKQTQIYAHGPGSDTVKSLYNATRYNMDLDITLSCSGSQIFNNGILQRNYQKMTYSFVRRFL